MKLSAEDARKWGLASSIGPVLGGSVVLGWLAGDWLDRHLGTQPFGLVAGLLLGSAAGFLEVFNILKRLRR